jgi:hypothetical protein
MAVIDVDFERGSMRDAFFVWGLGLGAYLTSIGHWIQGLVSIGLGISTIVGCAIACVRLRWDWVDRAKRQAGNKRAS